VTAVLATQIAADLLTAANHIETYGHLKFHYGRKGLPCCATGAIQVAVYGATITDHLIDRDSFDLSPEKTARAHAAYDELKWHLAIRHVPDWNDAPERTQAEVVAGLRGAAHRVSPGATTDGRPDQ
jgi:hypothetical protein